MLPFRVFSGDLFSAGLYRVILRGEQSLPIKVTPRKLPPTEDVKVADLKKGLQFELFVGDFKKLPDFATLAAEQGAAEQGAAEKGITESLDLNFAEQQKGSFAVTFDGFVSVPATGVYRITIKSDDGSRVLLHDRLLINHGGTHPATAASKRVRLEAGLHPIQIDYFQASGERSIEMTVEKQGSDTRQESDAPVFFHKPMHTESEPAASAD